MTEALSEVCVHDSKLMHLVAVGLPRGQGPQGNNKKKNELFILLLNGKKRRAQEGLCV